MIDAFETYGSSALLFEYRHMYNKRLSLLRNLHQEMPQSEVTGRKILVIAYLAFTIGMTIMILFLYFVQPHLL